MVFFQVSGRRKSNENDDDEKGQTDCDVIEDEGGSYLVLKRLEIQLVVRHYCKEI